MKQEHKTVNELYNRQLQFRGALEQIGGSAFTPPQKTFILPLLGVLLHKDDTTFHDLVRFLDDNRNHDLVEYGKAHLPNAEHRNFFKSQFRQSTKTPTKEALSARFSDIAGNPAISDFLCKKSTFDFEKCIESGKVIVFEFRFGDQNKDAITTIGQLINAYLVSYAMSRKSDKARPIHLFADECQYFVSPTIEEIMGETRKFGLYATLATQRVEQTGKPLLKAILGNVGCYFVGRSLGDTAILMGKELPVNASEIREMESLQFYQIEPDRKPVKLKIPILSGKHVSESKAWKSLCEKQKMLYYRKLQPNKIVPKHENSGVNHQEKEQLYRPMFDGPDFSKV